MTTNDNSPNNDSSSALTTNNATVTDIDSTLSETVFALDEMNPSLFGSVTGYVRRVRGGELGSLPAVAGFLTLCLYFGFKNEYFFTARNFANLLTQSSATIVIAMGLIFVLLLGEIDLSAGATAGVAAAILAVQLRKDAGLPSWLLDPLPSYLSGPLGHFKGVPYSLTLALLAGLLIGAFTGLLVARVGIPSFVVTLALFLAWQGVVLRIVGSGGNIPITNKFVNGIANKNLSPTNGWIFYAIAIAGFSMLMLARWFTHAHKGLAGESITTVLVKIVFLGAISGVTIYVLNLNRNKGAPKRLEGVPLVVPIIFVLLLVLTFLLGRTTYGRHLYAVGGNAEAARRAGINVRWIRLSAFMLCSFLAAIGGVFLASRLNSVDPQTGGGNQLLFAVGAAVIGGTSLFGGRGKIRDAILGGLVIAVIDNGLGLLKYDSGGKYIWTGAVLLVAASVDALSRKGAATTR